MMEAPQPNRPAPVMIEARSPRTPAAAQEARTARHDPTHQNPEPASPTPCPGTDPENPELVTEPIDQF